MSEIEKMYENAGVEAKNKCKSLQCVVTNPHPDWCNKCESLSKVYPPFTAEKQIELLKWLGNNKNGFGFFNDGTEGLSCHCDFHWEWFKESFYAEDFDNALAGLINKLWQDLTEEEKQQVKGILE